MEKTTPRNLEDAVMLLENAAIIRQRRKSLPPSVQEPDETTEDDVFEAMSLDQMLASDITREKDKYIRALRIIIKSQR